MQLRSLTATGLRNQFYDDSITFISFQGSIAAAEHALFCLLIKFRSDSLPRFAFILNTREKLAEQLPSVAFSFFPFCFCDRVVKA